MENSGQRYTLDWVTVEGDAQPGVDLTDRDTLTDRMEKGIRLISLDESPTDV